MKLSQPAIFLGILSLALSNLSFAEGVKFQLKFEPGKSYHTQTSMEQSAEMVMAGQKVNSQVEMNLSSVQKATAVEKGIEVKQSVVSVKMDMNAGGMQMNFDSENPEGPFAAMFQPMLDAKSTAIYSLEGKIIEVDVPAVPGMENLGMGQEELEQSVREVADLMPNRMIEVGEGWKSESQLSMGGMTEKPVKINYEINFEGMVERDGHEVAKVNIEGVIQDGDDNVKVTSNLLEGVMYFDPAIGQPREMTMTMDLEIGLPEGAAVAAGATGKMPMKVKTNSRLLEVK
jgi:hypothetical protein